MKPRLIWDLPTRLFHWILVILFSISLYTGLSGGLYEMDYHMLSGYAIFTLIIFRIIWGFVASGNARFSNFIRGPKVVWHYIFDNNPTVNREGHNPLGALSIIAILFVFLLQAVTGLFTNDDIFLEGPLSHLVSYSTSRQLTALHKLNVWVIGFLTGLHILAVAYHEIVKKDRLILPMLTGRKLSSMTDEVRQNHQIVKALVIILACTGFTYFLVKYV